jgi:hypothetical protein
VYGPLRIESKPKASSLSSSSANASSWLNIPKGTSGAAEAGMSMLLIAVAADAVSLCPRSR